MRVDMMLIGLTTIMARENDKRLHVDQRLKEATHSLFRHNHGDIKNIIKNVGFIGLPTRGTT